ncbi:unnamed protein product [Periconia digitata]|uniref:Secreted protein n=1 Tax=Periconia digitata TaxID=1303443 RepID=A0A9W4UKY3_9PLEO|nr:unnamed protein product [Periconia digitata]
MSTPLCVVLRLLPCLHISAVARRGHTQRTLLRACYDPSNHHEYPQSHGRTPCAPVKPAMRRPQQDHPQEHNYLRLWGDVVSQKLDLALPYVSCYLTNKTRHMIPKF